MTQLCRWSTVTVLFAVSFTVFAQSAPPKLIDVHEHFNGEPGVLEQLLTKLSAADGMGILLTTPKGLPEASEFIRQHDQPGPGGAVP